MLTKNITLRTLPVKRSDGQSAVAGAAYRAGERLTDSRLDKTNDYTGRSPDVWHKEILAPDGAPDWVFERERLWNEAEAAERRKDGRPARDVTLGLPWFMNREEHEEAARSFVRREFVDQGHVVDLCFHKYGKRVDGISEDSRATLRRWAERDVPFLEAAECEGLHEPHVKIERDGRERVVGYKIFQPHAHAYITPRAIEEDGFAAKRNRQFDRAEQTKEWRYDWPAHLNARLEAEGYDFRVSAMAEQSDENLSIRPQDMPLTSYHIELEGTPSPVREEREFNAVHNDAVRVAENTAALEEAGVIETQPERFARVRAWFQSMRQSFSEWREHLEERAHSWFQRSEEPDEPEPEPPPDVSPDPNNTIKTAEQELGYDDPFSHEPDHASGHEPER